MELTITKVTIYPFDKGGIGIVKGMAHVELNGVLYIRALRILERDGELELGYPKDPFYNTKYTKDAEYVVQPTSSPEGQTLRDAISDAVLTKYRKYMEGKSNG